LNKIVHPDDKKTWAQHILHRTESLQITTIEFRIIRKDGEIRWIEHSCLPVYGKGGKWLGRRASNRDITDRKLAEEQMHRLASQLITIQENERLNIARDLHDEIGQAMAVLGFNLNTLLAEAPPEQVSLQERIHECIQILDTTTEHLRQIAYQLRPPALDTLPLSQTLQGLCLSFNRQCPLKINFSAEDKIPSLPDTFALSFYRLAQEGLTNAVKHAQASSAWVSLDYDQGLVSLQVEDDGQGFNPQTTPLGIGLQGLRERFQMLGGSVDIESAPGKGTRLDGYLPWQP
jgi:two-component system sensor histidine kinase UhpB